MSFRQTFNFEYESPTLDVTLQVSKYNIFEEIPIPLSKMPQWTATFEKPLECYNISGDLYDDDSRDVHILENEVNIELEGLEITSK